MTKRLGLALFAVLLTASHAGTAAAQTEGGSTQTRAQDGCSNQWLFNGMWRVRATNVAFQPKDDTHANAWTVAMQWANGTPFEGIAPDQTLLNPMQLALANGDTIASDATRGGLTDMNKLTGHTFAASSQFTYTQQFASTDVLDQNNKPAKLLITFDVAGYQKGHPGGGKFWNQKTPAYNYRINLNCTK